LPFKTFWDRNGEPAWNEDALSRAEEQPVIDRRVQIHAGGLGRLITRKWDISPVREPADQNRQVLSRHNSNSNRCLFAYKWKSTLPPRLSGHFWAGRAISPVSHPVATWPKSTARRWVLRQALLRQWIISRGFTVQTPWANEPRGYWRRRENDAQIVTGVRQGTTSVFSAVAFFFARAGGDALLFTL
jgi:hypothetical protein